MVRLIDYSSEFWRNAQCVVCDACGIQTRDWIQSVVFGIYRTSSSHHLVTTSTSTSTSTRPGVLDSSIIHHHQPNDDFKLQTKRTAATAVATTISTAIAARYDELPRKVVQDNFGPARGTALQADVPYGRFHVRIGIGMSDDGSNTNFVELHEGHERIINRLNPLLYGTKSFRWCTTFIPAKDALMKVRYASRSKGAGCDERACRASTGM